MSTRPAATLDLIAGGVGDMAVVDALMRASFDPRFGEAWTTSQCLGVLALPGVWLTIAHADGNPAGFALARAVLDEAELLLLAVAPRARRRGVGGALLRSVIADARDRRVARLHLEVRAGNDAVALYRSAGFEQVGQRRNYYKGAGGAQIDAQTFALSLSDFG